MFFDEFVDVNMISSKPLLEAFEIYWWSSWAQPFVTSLACVRLQPTVFHRKKRARVTKGKNVKNSKNPAARCKRARVTFKCP